MPRNTEAEVPENDVTTLDGWLAEYDRLAAKYHRERNWCDLRWAYSRDTGGEDHVPSPERRKPPAGRPPAGCLTEEGVAWFAAQDEDSLSRKKRGARRSVLYGMRHGNLTLENAREAAERLQLGTITGKSAWNVAVTFNQAKYFTRDEEPTADQRRTLENALKKATGECLTAAGIPVEDNAYTVSVLTSRQDAEYEFVTE
jgi:hypothetical protein